MDRLLQLLSTNSGFTTAEIATMLGEPEDYIKAQIKEYETQGIIKGYQAVVNWENTKENYVEALIELKVTPKKDAGFDEMAKMCMAFDEVDSVYLMAGTYDFALIVKGESMQDIAMFVSKKSYKFFKEQSDLQGKMTAYVSEMFSSQKIVKSYSYEKRSIENKIEFMIDA